MRRPFIKFMRIHHGGGTLMKTIATRSACFGREGRCALAYPIGTFLKARIPHKRNFHSTPLSSGLLSFWFLSSGLLSFWFLSSVFFTSTFSSHYINPIKNKKTGMANIQIIIFCVVLKNFLASSMLYYMLTFFSPRRMTKGGKTRRFPIISCCKFTHCITIALANFHLKHFPNSFMPIIPLKF